MDVEVVPEFYDLFRNSEILSSKFITSWLFIRGKREIRNPPKESQKKKNFLNRGRRKAKYRWAEEGEQ